MGRIKMSMRGQSGLPIRHRLPSARGALPTPFPTPNFLPRCYPWAVRAVSRQLRASRSPRPPAPARVLVLDLTVDKHRLVNGLNAQRTPTVRPDHHLSTTVPGMNRSIILFLSHKSALVARRMWKFQWLYNVYLYESCIRSHRPVGSADTQLAICGH